jgi:Uma2 family endonuclease
MPNVAEQLTSLDEFVAWERDQPERYEYAGGVITMMTGGSAAHVTIAMNLAFALRHALRGTGCRPFGSDMKVIANHPVRYPDISVICRPVGDRDNHLSDPVVIIEVISPSTEREDRGRKNSTISRRLRSGNTRSSSRTSALSIFTRARAIVGPTKSSRVMLS